MFLPKTAIYKKTQIINNSTTSYDKNPNNMSHKLNNAKNTKNTKSKKLKHVLLTVLIIFLAAGVIGSIQQNKSNNTKTKLSALECKNIAKNYVADDFLSLNAIKKKMTTSECSAKDSESTINYLDNTYDFNNVAVRKLRLLVEDDNSLTEKNAKSKLENLEFNKEEIEFAINHYSDEICSVKKNDLSCEIEKDSSFAQKDKDDKSKNSKDNNENKPKSSSNGDSDNKNQTNANKTNTKKNSTNKSSVDSSNSNYTQSENGNAEEQKENQQTTQAPVQQQAPAPATQPAPAPQQQPQQQQLPLVHPGSFCSTSGQQGVTIRGTLMMCQEGVNDGRLRWRKVR